MKTKKCVYISEIQKTNDEENDLIKIGSSKDIEVRVFF